MRVEQLTDRIYTYKLSFDKTDTEYSLCRWATYIFNKDTGNMQIYSDAGNFEYHWGITGNDDFMKFIGKISKEYLINKLSAQSIFNVSKTKKYLIDNINNIDYGINDESQISSVIYSINSISEMLNVNEFISEVERILPDINLNVIKIHYDYSHGAEIVVDYFIKYIQPVIKNEFE